MNILDSEVDEKFYLSEKATHRALTNKRSRACEMDVDFAPTLMANQYKQSTDSIFFIKEGVVRRPTPNECARLQGFPDNWNTDVVSDSQAYKQFGNAISVPLVRALFDNLLK